MKIEKIFIASDHAGYEIKQKCIEFLSKFEVIDLGCDSTQSVDYPDYAFKLAKNLLANLSENSYGILICGTGIGMSIAANRFDFIRCALCKDSQDAKLAREHNNANVIAFGARNNSFENIKNMLEVFFSTDFLQGRHEVRVNKLKKS